MSTATTTKLERRFPIVLSWVPGRHDFQDRSCCSRKYAQVQRAGKSFSSACRRGFSLSHNHLYHRTVQSKPNIQVLRPQISSQAAKTLCNHFIFPFCKFCRGGKSLFRLLKNLTFRGLKIGASESYVFMPSQVTELSANKTGKEWISFKIQFSGGPQEYEIKEEGKDNEGQ
jgi:hypothetical protein